VLRVYVENVRILKVYGFRVQCFVFKGLEGSGCTVSDVGLRA